MPVKITRSVGRPSTIGVAIEIWLDKVATWAREWQLGSGHFTKRSDSSLNSYEVIITKSPDGGMIVADPAVPWALQGRKSSSKFPPWTPEEGFKEIKQWIIDKPLQLSPDDNIDSVAFLIARKIKEKGTSDPKLVPQNIDLVINNFGKESINKLGDDLAEDIANGMVKTFKRGMR